MKVERNFNKRAAQLIDVQQPHVAHGKGDPLGIGVTLFTAPAQDNRDEVGSLRMHLTPEEALTFGSDLIAEARDRLKAQGKLAPVNAN